jgi:hypothetical protein
MRLTEIASIRVLATLGYLFLMVSSSSLSFVSVRGGVSNDVEGQGTLPLHGLKPDTFVLAAPLIVAAVCQDGVVVLAAHTTADDEPLLYHSYPDGDSNSSNETTASSPFQDLPSTFGGPFRIQPIDAFGTTLVCTGWRADCERLITRCRALATTEMSQFGAPSQRSIYGRYLATELSFYMAQCALSERVSMHESSVTSHFKLCIHK